MEYNLRKKRSILYHLMTSKSHACLSYLFNCSFLLVCFCYSKFYLIHHYWQKPFFPLSLLRFFLGLLHIIDIILIVVSFLALKNITSFSCRSFIYKKYTTVINDAVFHVFAYFRFVCRQGICFSHLKLCLTLNFISGYCSRLEVYRVLLLLIPASHMSP